MIPWGYFDGACEGHPTLCKVGAVFFPWKKNVTLFLQTKLHSVDTLKSVFKKKESKVNTS